MPPPTISWWFPSILVDFNILATESIWLDLTRFESIWLDLTRFKIDSNGVKSTQIESNRVKSTQTDSNLVIIENHRKSTWKSNNLFETWKNIIRTIFLDKMKNVNFSTFSSFLGQLLCRNKQNPFKGVLFISTFKHFFYKKNV